MRKKSKEDASDGGNQPVASIVWQSAGTDIADIIAKAEAEGKNPAAVLLGRRGGLKGGRARAVKLSAEKRREIAMRAAKARWHKARGE